MIGYRIGLQTKKGVLYIPLESYRPYILILASGKQIQSTNIVSLKKELT